jgi:voltage-gated potassium channel
MKRPRRTRAERHAREPRATTEFRRSLYQVLEHGWVGPPLSRALSAALIALIVVNVACAVLESVPAYESRYRPWFNAVELVSLLLFSLEYVARLWAAGAHDEARPFRAGFAYARSFGGIVDLIAIAPFWIGLFLPVDLRAVLIFRIFRLLKLARYSLGVRSLLDALYEERRPLAGCVVIFLGTTLIAASLMYLAERDAQPDKLGTIPLAMWWAVTTLGTTGYGDVVPATAIGRLIAGATIMAALAMIALPVGLIATAFAEQIHKRDFVVTWGMVARVPLFSHLSAAEIASVVRLLSSQTFAPGDIVARRGEPARSMFFICTGEVEIQLDDGSRRFGQGHFFGEVAVLRKARRSATVVAIARSHLLVLAAADLHALMGQDVHIAQKLREVTRARLGKELVTKAGDLVTEELEDGGAAG